MKDKTKILVIVEGEKTDVRLMKRILNIYQLSDSHEIVSYKTNIYSLYQEMFEEKDPSTMDLLQLLKEKEHNPEKRNILDERYSDIILIFDFDPQDPLFTPEKIKRMLAYFQESSNMGKLYINYPMVESFYYMKTIPDEHFSEYCVAKQDIPRFKEKLDEFSIKKDQRKFAKDKNDYDNVIKCNYEKAKKMTNSNAYQDTLVLEKECSALEKEERLYVLCTCIFYILDYNPNLVFKEIDRT